MIRRGGAGLPVFVLAQEAGGDEPFDLDRIPSEAGGIARLNEGRDTVGEKQDDEKQAQDHGKTQHDRKAQSRVRASGPSGRAVSRLTACPASHPTLRVFVSRRPREYQPR
ncbi:hypothetical protein FHT36_002634 [Xanthobacter sp. SG618]|uniref:hypothetical protein n=1 Tax=Xanthobacter sp. SG618 TaxID=2587121 RepID=UPI00145D018E|nr:hypothetical protein [Xanthobacter sp. SG618]NMN58726.1 hypothetical protein [Xanthobacter sp. SG618]